MLFDTNLCIFIYPSFGLVSLQREKPFELRSLISVSGFILSKLFYTAVNSFKLMANDVVVNQT